MNTNATNELTDAEQLHEAQHALVNRFLQACATARRTATNAHHLLVNVTRLWNWIDADGIVADLELTEALWELLAVEFPEAFADPSQPNSVKFTYLESRKVQVIESRDGIVLRTESNGGFKSSAAYVIEAAGCKWSHRRRGYDASATQRDVILWALDNGFSAHTHFGMVPPATQPLFSNDTFQGVLPGLNERLSYHTLRKLRSAVLKGKPLSLELISQFFCKVGLN